MSVLLRMRLILGLWYMHSIHGGKLPTRISYYHADNSPYRLDPCRFFPHPDIRASLGDEDCRTLLEVRFIRKGDLDETYNGLTRLNVWNESVQRYLYRTGRIVDGNYRGMCQPNPALGVAPPNTLLFTITDCITAARLQWGEVYIQLINAILVVLEFDPNSTNFTLEDLNKVFDFYATFLYLGFPEALVLDSLYRVWTERVSRYFNVHIDDVTTMQWEVLFKPSTINAFISPNQSIARLMDVVFVKGRVGLFAFQYALIELLMKDDANRELLTADGGVIRFMNAMTPKAFASLWERTSSVYFSHYNELLYLSYPGLSELAEGLFWLGTPFDSLHGKLWYQYVFDFVRDPTSSLDLKSSFEKSMELVPDENHANIHQIHADIIRTSRETFAFLNNGLFSFFESISEEYEASVVESLADWPAPQALEPNIDVIKRGLSKIFILLRSLIGRGYFYGQHHYTMFEWMLRAINFESGWVTSLDQLAIMLYAFAENITIREALGGESVIFSQVYLAIDSMAMWVGQDGGTPITIEPQNLKVEILGMIASAVLPGGPYTAFAGNLWGSDNWGLNGNRFGMGSGIVGLYALYIAAVNHVYDLLHEAPFPVEENALNDRFNEINGAVYQTVRGLNVELVKPEAHKILMARLFRLTLYALYGTFLESAEIVPTREYVSSNEDLVGMKINPAPSCSSAPCYATFIPINGNFVRIRNSQNTNSCFEYYAFPEGSVIDRVSLPTLIDGLSSVRSWNKNVLGYKKYTNIGYDPCGTAGKVSNLFGGVNRVIDSVEHMSSNPTVFVPRLTTLNCDVKYLYLTCAFQTSSGKRISDPSSVIYLNRQQSRFLPDSANRNAKIDPYCLKPEDEHFKQLDIQTECHYMLNNYMSIVSVAEIAHYDLLADRVEYDQVLQGSKSSTLPYQVKLRRKDGPLGFVLVNTKEGIAEQFLFDAISQISSMEYHLILKVMARLQSYSPGVSRKHFLPHNIEHMYILKSHRVSCSPEFALVTCDFIQISPSPWEQRSFATVQRLFSEKSRKPTYTQLCDRGSDKTENRSNAAIQECEFGVSWMFAIAEELGKVQSADESETALSFSEIQSLENALDRPLVQDEL